jgi:hypothetical protein
MYIIYKYNLYIMGIFSSKQKNINSEVITQIGITFPNNLLNNKNKNKKNSDQLNIISWNIEDFVKKNKIYESVFFNVLREQDIILLQEWKPIVGDDFVDKLNENSKNKFIVISTDRVAVLFKSNLFNLKETKAYDIKLEYEKPTISEQAYTKGRQKSNMLVILYPYNKNPLCIVPFHLSAYMPSQHPGFHSKQLKSLINNAIKQINSLGINDYGIIIGGDTNYRKTEKNYNITKLKNHLIGNLNKNLKYKLKNACEGKCDKKTTQSFKCVHEKSANKSLVWAFSRLFNETRLDLLLTNLEIKDTEIVDLCKYSDHSAIVSELVW